MKSIYPVVALLSTSVLFAIPAHAQSYPTKPVTVLTSIVTGSPTDLECRAVANYLAASFKQPFIVESRPGAGGAIAAAAVAHAPPDGYTLFCSGPAPTTFKVLIKDLSFDPLKDLLPITQFAEFVTLFLTGNKSGINSMDELIAYAKANPGKLNYASAGRNSVVLAMEAVKSVLKINLTEVPYAGTAQAVTAAMANDVQFIMSPIGFARGQIDAGNLRPLMVLGSTKSVLYPNLPTLDDKGIDIPTGTWEGLFAPGGTPKSIVDRIAAGAADYTRSPEAKARQNAGLMVFASMTPDEFQRKVGSEAERYTEIAKRLGWTPQ